MDNWLFDKNPLFEYLEIEKKRTLKHWHSVDCSLKKTLTASQIAFNESMTMMNEKMTSMFMDTFWRDFKREGEFLDRLAKCL